MFVGGIGIFVGRQSRCLSGGKCIFVGRQRHVCRVAKACLSGGKDQGGVGWWWGSDRGGCRFTYISLARWPGWKICPSHAKAPRVAALFAEGPARFAIRWACSLGAAGAIGRRVLSMPGGTTASFCAGVAGPTLSSTSQGRAWLRFWSEEWASLFPPSPSPIAPRDGYRTLLKTKSKNPSRQA